MSSHRGTTKIEMTEIKINTSHEELLGELEILGGEGSMLREKIHMLKAKESKLMGDLRDTMQELEKIRFRLNHVNNEIARLSNATR